MSTRKPMSRKLAAQVVQDLSNGLSEESIRKHLAARGNDPDQVESYMVLALAQPLTERSGAAPALCETAGRKYITHLRKQQTTWQAVSEWLTSRLAALRTQTVGAKS